MNPEKEKIYLDQMILFLSDNLSNNFSFLEKIFLNYTLLLHELELIDRKIYSDFFRLLTQKEYSTINEDLEKKFGNF